jgi:hypothetical protein
MLLLRSCCRPLPWVQGTLNVGHTYSGADVTSYSWRPEEALTSHTPHINRSQILGQAIEQHMGRSAVDVRRHAFVT